MTATAESSRMLEAMRLGVVPSGDVSAFTVGRDLLLRRIDACLSDAAAGRGAVLTVLGDYGTGKTHSLELVAHRARDAGFVVAHATLGAEETAPSHPARVYRSLVRSLSYPDRGAGGGDGLRPLLDRAIRSEEAAERFGLNAAPNLDTDHLYLSPLLRYWAVLHHEDPDVVLQRRARGRRFPSLDDAERAQAEDTLLGWFEASHQARTDETRLELERLLGNRGRLYSMKDYRPWSRIYAYILSGLADLCRATGYRGLVVLLDEAEFYHVLASADRDYARTLFKAMTWAAAGHRDDLPFEAAELQLGGQGVLQRLPPRASEDSPLFTVFAMTPAAQSDEDVLDGVVPADSVIELTHLSAEDYAQLVERVIAVYFTLRPSRVPQEALARALASTMQRLRADGRVQTPRHAMKFLLDLLDVLHHRPSELKRVLAELRDVVTQADASAGEAP